MIARDLQFKRGSFSLGPIHYDFSAPNLYFISGKNGSGKSTLVKLLCRRLRPSAGSISSDDSPLGTIGVENLFPGSWSLGEIKNWYLHLSQKHLRHPEYLDSLKVSLERKLYTLSSGQIRAFELSLVLGTDLSTYLLDEAFQNLDADAAELFAARISERVREGARVIFTLHQLKEAERMGLQGMASVQL